MLAYLYVCHKGNGLQWSLCKHCSRLRSLLLLLLSLAFPCMHKTEDICFILREGAEYWCAHLYPCCTWVLTWTNEEFQISMGAGVSATWAIDVATILFVSLSSCVVSETCTSFTPTCITLTDNTICMGSFNVYTWCIAIKWRVNVVDSLSDVSNHCLHESTHSKFRFQHRPHPFNLYVHIRPIDLYTQTKNGSLIAHCFYNLHTIPYLPP